MTAGADGAKTGRIILHVPTKNQKNEDKTKGRRSRLPS
jgi:hypothetical protein